MTASEGASPRRRRVRKTSTFESLEEIVEAADAFARRFLDSDEVVHRLVLATSEAVTNAIVHGNASDPAKHVTVDFLARDGDGGGLEVVVTDEGGGFDPSAVESPIEEENLTRAHGRGLYIISTVADTVAFEEGGRRVRMAFRCPQ